MDETWNKVRTHLQLLTLIGGVIFLQCLIINTSKYYKFLVLGILVIYVF